MKTFALAALACFALSTVACASAPVGEDVGASSANATEGQGAISNDNWQAHSSITAIDEEVKAIDAASFSLEKKELCANFTYGDVERTKMTDAEGIIRKLVTVRGDSSSKSTLTYYYDEKGVLRFSSSLVQTVDDDFQSYDYFDAKGSHFWSATRTASVGEDGSDPNLEAEPFDGSTDEPILIHDDAASPAKMWSASEECSE